VTLDQNLVEAIKEDYTTAPITGQERVMLDYVVKLTQDATRVSKVTMSVCEPPGSMTKRSCRSH
jgi:hypothetical protein